MPCLLAVLEYDGTNFFGSQFQPGRRTVQGEVEQALTKLTREKTRVILAGRTDSGVHATGQVARVVFPEGWHGSAVAGLNALLPEDISVREVSAVPEEFNPRHWAVARQYTYSMYCRNSRSALEGRYSWHLPIALDTGKMREAAMLFLGRHDFSAFGQPPQGDNYTRTIQELRLEEHEERLSVVIVADAFLRRMVRLIVGALVDVGRQKIGVDTIGDLIARGEPSKSQAAPAQGLCLNGVAYERQRLGWGEGCWWSYQPRAVEN